MRVAAQLVVGDPAVSGVLVTASLTTTGHDRIARTRHNHYLHAVGAGLAVLHRNPAATLQTRQRGLQRVRTADRSFGDAHRTLTPNVTQWGQVPRQCTATLTYSTPPPFRLCL